MPRKKPKPSLDKRLLAYSATAGALLAGGPADASHCNEGVLNGSICHTDIVDVILSPLSLHGIDFDGANGYEFRFLNYVSGSGYNRYMALVAEAGSDELVSFIGGFTSATRGSNPAQVAALLADDVIDQSNMRRAGCPKLQDNFGGKGDRYVGVKIFLATESTTHFGWVRINVSAPGGLLTIKEFAYNTTPDAPIDAATTWEFADGFESGDTSAWSAVATDRAGRDL